MRLSCEVSYASARRYPKRGGGYGCSPPARAGNLSCPASLRKQNATIIPHPIRPHKRRFFKKLARISLLRRTHPHDSHPANPKPASRYKLVVGTHLHSRVNTSEHIPGEAWAARVRADKTGLTCFIRPTNHYRAHCARASPFHHPLQLIKQV